MSSSCNGHLSWIYQLILNPPSPLPPKKSKQKTPKKPTTKNAQTKKMYLIYKPPVKSSYSCFKFIFNLFIFYRFIITVKKNYSTFLQHVFYIIGFKNISIENTLADFGMRKNYLLSRQTVNRIQAKKTFFFFVSESKSSIH